MITDADVQQLIKNCHIIISKHCKDDIPLLFEFFRGITPRLWKEDPYPSKCLRHKLVFETFNIIPRYCFDCYKITIEPRTVVELFKLMIVFFDRLDLPNDNTRKCTVETREGISGTYKGLVYSQNLEEAKDIYNIIKNVLSEEISPTVPVALKRGCSEFSLAYPEYSKIENDGKPVMEYNEEWQKYEDLADENNLGAHFKPFANDTNNHPGFNIYDALIMHTWLMYASTIGDLSYLKITEQPIPKLENLKRPPFRAVEGQ